MDERLDEEAIFHVARGISDDVTRTAYLDQICAGDAQLRERVDVLLDADEVEQTLLSSTPNADATPGRLPTMEAPGDQIGRYKLLQQIGEGGFGVVYMAEQQRPVRRKIALKIIKPGMDTGAVIARFEAERQALALMDHPNIARVLDGGTTDHGRPYFAMELVKGVPITEFCDKNQLSTEERARLFITVCQAVQHAHQKGIIHRDIKPSNVLVTLADGNPVVKVIDFGVAKATNQQLTERTLFTAFGQMVGTPQYMSPEQAEMSCLDVDTRSDVYSLGVLLYELLTGTTPLEGDRLRTAGYTEMQKIIQQDEPPKPSTRLSMTGEGLATIAKQRKATPEKLTSFLRGELDWIVMKSLEKDRSRRYDTAAGLGDDLERFLVDEPVSACPPSALYRFQKFSRRNRGVIIGGTMFVGLLLIALVSTFTLYRSANNTLRSLRDELVQKALVLCWQGDRVQAEEAIEQARQAGASPAWVEMLYGQKELYGGSTGAAVNHLKSAVKLEPKNASARAMLATSYMFHGDFSSFQESLQRLMALDLSDPHDALFIGQALAIAMAPDAINYVETGLRRRNTPFAHAIRAKLWAWKAIDIDDGELMAKAIAQANAVKGFIPENAYVDMIYTDVHHAAYMMDQNLVDRDRLLGVLSETNRMDDYSIGLLVRGACLDSAGKLAEAERALQQASKLGDWWSYYDALLIRERRFDDGYRFISSMCAKYGPQLIREADAAFLQALSTGTVPDLRKLIDDAGRQDTSVGERYWVAMRLLQLGERDAAIQLAEKRSPVVVGALNDVLKKSLQHLAGKLTTEQLLAEVKESKGERAISLCYLGVESLSRGDLVEARSHLEGCIALNSLLREEHATAKACLSLLGCMDRLPWIETVPQPLQKP